MRKTLITMWLILVIIPGDKVFSSTFIVEQPWVENEFSFHIESDQVNTYSYLDSTQANLNRNYESHAVQEARVEEGIMINKLLKYLVTLLLFLIVVILVIISFMHKKINTILSELIGKNSTQTAQEQKMKNKIKPQSDIDHLEEVQPLTSKQREILLYSRFCEWLENEKPYLLSDFDLISAARVLGTNRSYLSKAINSQGAHFTELVNKYRVSEVIKILNDTTHAYKHTSLQEIAQKAGFQTKSVFFDAFKKEVGMTPHQYKENLQHQEFNKNML